MLFPAACKFCGNIPANILKISRQIYCLQIFRKYASVCHNWPHPLQAEQKLWRGDINGRREKERWILGFVWQMCKYKYWTTFSTTERNRNLKFSIEGDWNTVSPLNWLVRPCVTWWDIVTGWHGVTRWHGVTQRHDSSGCPSDWCHSCLPAREGSRVILWDLRTLYFLCNAKTN